MPKRSNPFQNLSTSIMAALHGTNSDVQESVLVTNKRTAAVRELDIQITHRENPDQKLLVECRDHRRKQDVQWIDQLEGKAGRLGFSHVVAVSSSGFTKPAIAERRERGIGTLHLREAEAMDWASWKFGLERFGLCMHFDPIVRQVQLVVRAGFAKPLPQGLTFDRVAIIDAKKNTKIGLSDWISGFQQDPKTAEKFAKHPESNTIQHYNCTIPCDPWIGIIVEPGGQTFPLESLVLSIDRINADYQVALRHYCLGTEKFHVGHVDILGRQSKVVAHETDGGRMLSIMIEQLVHVDDKRYMIDFERGGELVVNLDNGDVVKCPTVQPPEPSITLLNRELADQGKAIKEVISTKRDLAAWLQAKGLEQLDISSIPSDAVITEFSVNFENPEDPVLNVIYADPSASKTK